MTFDDWWEKYYLGGWAGKQTARDAWDAGRLQEQDRVVKIINQIIVPGDQEYPIAQAVIKEITDGQAPGRPGGDLPPDQGDPPPAAGQV